MWKDLIVEVFVPLQGGDGEDGEIATGYPVAPNRILTARHAVYPTDAVRDESRPIEVRWHHPNVTSEWRQAQGIAWEKKRWDLALLDCALPPEVSPWACFLSEQKPADTMQWAGVGFPKIAGKREGMRVAFDMKGGVFSAQEVKDRFDIDETAGPGQEDNWQGASGSPVVVNGRILGVIVEVPPGLGGKAASCRADVESAARRRGILRENRLSAASGTAR